MGDARDTYLEPEERLVLRTDDVYQTDKDVDTLNYSDKLLEIVATFSNSGQPEGWSIQSMVGRSKRGEVALRLFAVVEPVESEGVRESEDTGEDVGRGEAAECDDKSIDLTDLDILSRWRFGSVGFKSRGCLAMTACASAICDMIEDLTFEEALRITPDQVKDAVGGVPWDKLHTPVFAVEAIRGLVGDWIIRQGATFSQLEALLPCDAMSPHCLMCEHCSLRAFRTDLRMDEILGQTKGAGDAVASKDEDEAEDSELSPDMRELLENNALADLFDLVRDYSADSQLLTPSLWPDLDLIPDFTTPDDFEMFVYEYLEAYRAAHPLTRETHGKPSAEEAALPPEERTSAHGFRSATRAVSVAPSIREIMAAKRAQAEGRAEGTTDSANTSGIAGDTAPDGLEASNDSEQAASEIFADEPAATQVLGDEGSVLTNDIAEEFETGKTVSIAEPTPDAFTESVSEAATPANLYAGLRLPKGYEMVQLSDGQWALAPIPADRVPDRREVQCENIVALTGQYTYYLYDRTKMTDSYAHWAFLAAENNPLVTFADLVREDSRTYPRPMAQKSFDNEPFAMDAKAVEAAYEEALRTDGYEDIQRTEASNGDVYYFSTTYLSPRQAEALAEWASVERVANP